MSPTPWEIAKGLLIKDMHEGKLPSTMVPKVVYGMREEYREVEYSRFRTNLHSLRNTLQKLADRAAVDNAAVVQAQLAHPSIRDDNQPGFSYPRWDGSRAQSLLKVDVEAGNHSLMRPQQLRLTRDEYAPFPLDVFRKHIHAELRSRKDSAYWLVRQQKSKKNT
jgi:hypothetical protein